MFFFVIRFESKQPPQGVLQKNCRKNTGKLRAGELIQKIYLAALFEIYLLHG